MAAPYTLRNLTEVEDAAAGAGLGELSEVRFANDELEAESTGISHHRLKPGKRQGFGHRHDDAEEVYVVLSGSGRIKLDDDIVDLGPLDAIRIAPGVIRQLEAGSDGLEFLAVGPRHKGDAEMVDDWWRD